MRATRTRTGTRFVLLAALAGAAIALLPDSLWAQCAMCRTALEQNGGAIAGGFNRAILFLLAMPYVVFGAIAGTWLWRRRQGTTRVRRALGGSSWRRSPSPSPR